MPEPKLTVRAGFPLTMGHAVFRGSWLFALVMGTFNGMTCFLERNRGKRDGWNSAVAGFFGGHILGDTLVSHAELMHHFPVVSIADWQFSILESMNTFLSGHGTTTKAAHEIGQHGD